MIIIVCGAGTMGSGIAESAARAGYKTVLYDVSSEMVNRSKSSIEKNLEQQVNKKKLSADEKILTLERLSLTSNISECRGDIIIEAIVENIEAKTALYRHIAEINESSTIFASNTSSLSISAIAKEIPNPGRVCGMHFFNPAQVMKLVEVVEGDQTSQWVTEKVTDLARTMGKVPVTCKDSPGFIVNRVARHYYLESLEILQNGIADVEQIDNILESAGFRMGPFRLMDLIGNDINYAVSKSLYEACGKPVRFRPSPIQADKVKQGELGRKTSKGYYIY